MKRFFALLLTMGCLLMLLPGAHAEESALRILGGSSYVNQAYLEKYPDRGLEVIDIFDSDSNEDISKELIMTEKWDVAYVSSKHVSLGEVYAAGLAADLSKEAEIAANAEKLYPSVREALTAEGCLAAMPGWIFGLTTHMSYLTDYANDPDAAELLSRLGYKAEDMPKTYDELCDLAESYMALDRETRRGSVFLYLEGGHAEEYCLDRLVERYHAQHTDENGYTDFDTDTFRRALDSMERMLAAMNSDKKPLYGKNQSLWTLTDEGANGLMGYGDVADIHLLTVGEVETIPAMMDLVIVNPNSPRKAEAIDWLLTSLELLPEDMTLELYSDIDYDRLLRESYDREIAAQIYENEDQSVIDELIRLRDTGDDKYFTPKAVVESYARNVAPYLVFPLCPYLNTSKITAAYAKSQWIHEEIIEQLNDLSLQCAK